MKKYMIIVLLALATPVRLPGQETIPHISGAVKISVKKGSIECDLTLSRIPRLTDYVLRLNSGMNIRYIRNAEGSTSLNYNKSAMDTLSSGESAAYYIPSYTKSGKYLPYAIHLNYVGMFPVISDSSAVADWRGNIAFNGKTLRADGLQSAWSPILYDIATDTRYERVTYDLDISCDDCKAIYLNGSKPVAGQRAKFQSEKPNDLTMYAGDYKTVEIGGNYFLNPDTDDRDLTVLQADLQEVQKFFEKKSSIPYERKEVYIQTTPVSKRHSWLFVSYPTIVNVSWVQGMKSFSDKTEGASFRSFMAHELAHYYFGTVRTFNSELGDMISEGFAEFLALQITRTRISDSIYQQELQSKARSMENLQPVPFAMIRSRNDYRSRQLYVYNYAPLIFSAIEKEIGEAKMWEWIKGLLQTPASHTNYGFFEQTFIAAVKNKKQSDSLIGKYFRSDSTVENAIAKLNIVLPEKPATAGGSVTAKTYYYFFFSSPGMDAGTSQNRVIRYSNVFAMTGTPEEMKKMAQPIHKRIFDECENETGCTNNFNWYDSKEKADIRLKQLLQEFNRNNNMVVKVLELNNSNNR